MYIKIIKNNLIVLASIIFSILVTGCSFGQQEVNISNYKLIDKDEKELVVYNDKENTLNKITFFKTKDGKLLEYIETIFPIETEFVFGRSGMKYYHALLVLGCNYKNITKCIKDNLSEDSQYILQNNQKAYILDKNFGIPLFDTIESYKYKRDY